MGTERLRRLASDNQKSLVNFLRDMVRIPSLSGRENKMAIRVKKEMEKTGFEEVFIDGIGNVIGRIGSGKVRILYDAHMDTVDIGDRKNWKHNPFGAEYRRGTIYGRGACDDKAGVASAIYGGKLMVALGIRGDYTLYVACSVQEESAGGKGIEYLIKKDRINPHFVILAEPSSLNIIRGHKGRVGFKISMKGKSAHAGTPWKGKNAIYRMAPLIQKIERLNSRLSSIPPLGKGTIAVTKIDCEKASLNAIPDNCAIYLDRRTNTKESEQGVKRELRTIMGRGGKLEILQKFFTAWELPRKHPLVVSCAETYKALFRRNPKILLWPFCSNGSYTMGEKGIPTVVFGPGEERFAHSADEQVKVEQLVQAAMFYATLPGIIAKRYGKI
ncbi:YgeY family selenium metabolism-linked hydrolase [bacterium]|nr:YgeY family selenium metabolism-linked hydrolase [bacterium]NIN92078.1 YgeY family selenium metabolism-linked hydrolase [bacterium]NIO18291.1 YgeY family selenium metabolism-linked hydrolase [bacterium]NIO73265.1 YgeY family selenium metabolism-linked hydrolase [bacterium]